MKAPRKKRIIVLGIIAAVLIAALAYSGLFLNFVRVPTGSMMNTILPGECLVSNLLFSGIKRGEIVIFRYPMDTSTRFVSRVIGLPGDSIRCDAAAKKIYINDAELVEDRVFVEPRYDFDDTSALTPSKKDAGTGGGHWPAYYYEPDPDQPGSDAFAATFGVADKYQIPVKGNPLPDKIRQDTKLSRLYDANQDGKAKEHRLRRR